MERKDSNTSRERIPVGEEGAQYHERILELSNNFGRGVASQQELTTVLEGGECEVVVGPLVGHGPQFSLNVFFFDSRYTDVLKIDPQ